jgi:ribosomal protein L37AE/L43A
MVMNKTGLAGQRYRVRADQICERRYANMDCPRCKTALRIEDYRGIEVDRCPQCQGMWLDYGELDQLEDKVLDKDDLKGTLVYGA